MPSCQLGNPSPTKHSLQIYNFGNLPKPEQNKSYVLLEIIIANLKRSAGNRGFRNLITGLNNLVTGNKTLYAVGVFSGLSNASFIGLPTIFQEIFANNQEFKTLCATMAALNTESDDFMMYFLNAVFEDGNLERVFPGEFSKLRETIKRVQTSSTNEFHTLACMPYDSTNTSAHVKIQSSEKRGLSGFFSQLKDAFLKRFTHGKTRGRAASIRVKARTRPRLT